MNFRRYLIDIDLQAMRHNLDITRRLSSGSKILGIVKSNAYGHSISRVYPALKECEGLGVSDFQEAIHLRELGYTKKIVVLNGFTSQRELQACLEYDLTTVIHDFLQIKILKRITLPKSLNIWLKIDSGMNRLGFTMDCADSAINMLSKIKKAEIELLMTHWHSANEIHKSFTQEQFDKFMFIVNRYSLPVSMSNSAGIVGWDHTNDWVRPGLMLYGVSPVSKNNLVNELSLKPVMDFNSWIISMKECKQGEYIGYGATYQCQADMLVGIVPVGYGDGYPRVASGAPVMVAGFRTVTLGITSMEKIAVDLSKIADPKVNDKVIFWGNDLPIEMISQHAGRSPYELLCNIR